MKQVTISIPDNKYPFFIELVQSLGFAKDLKVDSASAKMEILEGLGEAVKQVNLHKKGKLKLKTAQEFLNEL
jgi:hypothetical protein